MQDRYAGDIGDLFKLALLRGISSGYSLGLAWYHFPDEGHNNDGRHVDYLDQKELYGTLDPGWSPARSATRSYSNLISTFLPSASSIASIGVR